jgi:hypothetical protein
MAIGGKTKKISSEFKTKIDGYNIVAIIGLIDTG